jgi:hypothetical protein
MSHTHPFGGPLRARVFPSRIATFFSWLAGSQVYLMDCVTANFPP